MRSPKTNLAILLGIGLLAIAAVTFAIVSQPAQPAQPTLSENGEGSSSSTSSAIASSSSTTSKTTTPAKGDYVNYSAEKLLKSGRNIIFFAAGWCPSCRALDGDILSNRNKIPADVRILKADYDSQVQLRQKYGVTIQHTLVEVTSSGELVEKWHGLYAIPTLADLIDLL